METKTCRKCGKTKPLDEFHKRPATADGLDRRCRLCRNTERAERRQRQRQKNRNLGRRKSKKSNTAINRMRKLLNDRLKPPSDHHA